MLNVNSNINVNFEKLYLQSQKYLQETIDSVSSKTLKRLYTDEFVPNELKSNQTTVLNLKSDLPVPAFIKTFSIEKYGDSERFLCVLKDLNKKILGIKSFGILQTSNGAKKLFVPGCIRSIRNNDFSGTQIRLLQAACEFASQLGIKNMPLISYLEAVNFHTMMGFRPNESFSARLTDLNCMQEKLKNWTYWLPKKYKSNDVVPILSKEGNNYFLDWNRTMFCIAVNKNKEYLESQHKRHIKPRLIQLDCIDMELKGIEFENWQKRIKGFEMIKDNDEIKKLPQLKRFFYEFICS